MKALANIVFQWPAGAGSFEDGFEVMVAPSTTEHGVRPKGNRWSACFASLPGYFLRRPGLILTGRLSSGGSPLPRDGGQCRR